MTDIEILVARLLTEMGYRYYEQYELPPYIVDFYIPEFKIVIEADGNVWHAYTRDRKRDLELMKKYKVRVLHYSENTIRKEPVMIKKNLLEEIARTSYHEVN